MPCDDAFAAIPSHPRQGLVLLGHGSSDPLWGQHLQTICAKIHQAQPTVHCALAFLQHSPPDAFVATEQLLGQGCTTVQILPLFIGLGQHLRRDLPLLVDALRAKHPQITFTLSPALAEDPRFIELLLKIATVQ